MALILIVDDDTNIHKVLDRILSIGGHEVVGNAYDGADAVRKFVKLNPKPNVILMDHRMPVMNGVTATKEIIQVDPTTRILFISSDDIVKDEALDSGAFSFLKKPVQITELLAAIEECTSTKSAIFAT